MLMELSLCCGDNQRVFLVEIEKGRQLEAAKVGKKRRLSKKN